VRRQLDILISGGAGFIGSNFARMLLDGTLSSKDSINSVTIIDILDYSGSLNNLGGLEDYIKIREQLKIEAINNS